MEVLDLDICHFVQYRPHQSDFDPMQLEVTIVERDRMWFEENLPLMQKFISDLESFKRDYNSYLYSILPKSTENPAKKRKREECSNCMIQNYDELKNEKDTYIEL